MRRFGLFLVVPTLLPLVWVILPFLSGEQTFYVRDVMTFFLPVKIAQAEALAEGRIALVDLARAGGQPALGNPNTLPLYPDNLLYLLGDPLWALSAHFWLHWLIAPFAFFWLCRAWDLSRPAAWGAGIFFASSGFFLSQLNLYNLVVIVALVPALIAACLESVAGKPGRFAVLGLLWALIVLAGDPFSALLGIFMALSAAGFRHGRAFLAHGRSLALAFALGTLVAAPMLVEFARILPSSFRTSLRDDLAASLAQSLNPWRLLEALLPLFFGQLDFGYWGGQFSDGSLPLLVSLAPGVVALALIATTFGRGALARAHGASWAWTMCAIGVFLALGVFNPVVAALYRLPLVGALRYPVKFLLLAAVALGLLVGIALERWLANELETRLKRILLVLTGIYLALTVALLFDLAPVSELLARLAGPALPAPRFELERVRWATTALVSLVVCGAAWLIVRLAGKSSLRALVFLVLCHSGSQLLLLESLYAGDTAAFYRQKPTLATALPANARLASGAEHRVFGEERVDLRQIFPDLRQFWLHRCFHEELAPPAGVDAGFDYALVMAPDGLDSLYSALLVRLLGQKTDAERIRALEVAGVDFLLLARILDDPRLELATQVDSSCGRTLFVYRLLARSPEFQVLGSIVRADSFGLALDRLLAPDFDPATMALVAGAGPDLGGGVGKVLEVQEGAEAISLEIDTPSASVVVTKRAFLPLWRATVDGAPAATTVVNVQNLGVEVPAGRHKVELWIDRRPTNLAFVVAALALITLIAWTISPFWRRT
jgi:hypothetical protein